MVTQQRGLATTIMTTATTTAQISAARCPPNTAHLHASAAVLFPRVRSPQRSRTLPGIRSTKRQRFITRIRSPFCSRLIHRVRGTRFQKQPFRRIRASQRAWSFADLCCPKREISRFLSRSFPRIRSAWFKKRSFSRIRRS